MWLSAVLASIGDAVIATDGRGRVLFMNPVAESLCGWSGTEAAGRRLDDVFRIINEDTRHPVEGAGGEQCCPMEWSSAWPIILCSWCRTAQQHRPIDDSGESHPWPGRCRGGCCTGLPRRDRAAEGEEDKFLEEMRRKDEFLAMLAHELRNPLAAIANAVQLLMHKEAEDAQDWSREVIERPVPAAHAAWCDDLLDVSRISRGKIQLRPQRIELAAVIRSAAQAVRPLIEERRHELRLSLAPEPIELEADPARLEQVLVNLFNNAAKYTEPGGRIEMEASRDAGHAVIRVTDTGIGIGPDLLPRVFDLFTQGDQTTSRSEGGLGIGLTMVRKLVELHDGSVSVSSDGPGRGSTFVVRLPARLGPAEFTTAARS